MFFAGKHHRHKGFTMVELLVVIIILGVMAGAMMLSTGASTDSAKAVTVISELRSMEAAAIAYYADFESWPVWIYTGSAYINADTHGNPAVLPQKYTDVTPARNGYWLGVMRHGSNPAICFAVADVSGLSRGVRAKIAEKATELPLYGLATLTMPCSPAMNALIKFQANDQGLMRVITH